MMTARMKRESTPVEADTEPIEVLMSLISSSESKVCIVGLLLLNEASNATQALMSGHPAPTDPSPLNIW